MSVMWERRTGGRGAVLLGASGAVVTFAMTLLASHSPIAALGILGAVGVALMTLRAPQWVLALGIVLTLTGGEFATYSTAGGLVLALGSFVGCIGALARKRALPVRNALWPLLILTYFAVRVGVVGDLSTAVDIIKCLSTVALVVVCASERDKLVVAMGIAGLTFLAASALLGENNALGTRFTGISGNSNRMVFAILVFIPFLLALARKHRAPTLRLLACIGIAASLALVAASGSSQGLVGLGAIVVVVLLRGLFAFQGGMRTMILVAIFTAIILLIDPILQVVRGSEDLSTLSGRTPLYAAAWDVIKQNPWLGTGLQSVSSNGVIDRSAHSAVLSLASSGGIPLGLAWASLMVALIIRTLQLSRRGDPLAAAAFVFVIEQLVQSVHLLSLSWFVVAFFTIATPGVSRSQDDLPTLRKALQ